VNKMTVRDIVLKDKRVRMRVLPGVAALNDKR